MAKGNGRDRVFLADIDDHEIAQHRGQLEWVEKIKDALENNQFELYGQRVIAVAPTNDHDEHVEVLIRMLGQDGEIIPPGAFIPAAERYDLMCEIDRWVVANAIERLGKLSTAEHIPTLMLNLSGQSLCNEQFLNYVIKQLEHSHVPANKVCFEITETAAIANLARAREFIEALKRKGCQIALDDFGSGLSSFSYLKSLPVDYLKIDGAFVHDMLDDAIDCAMVKSINEIGHVMQKKTVAEFVESPEILGKLRELGVDYAQGYGIERPMPLIACLAGMTERARNTFGERKVLCNLGTPCGILLSHLSLQLVTLM